MDNPISFPRVEGRFSRQAHADLPEGTYEREFGREGFFGAATHIYHAHPPTGWSGWEGPTRPRAFDTARLNDVATSPWDALRLLSNQYVDYRLWRADGAMDHLVRNGDGDELLFVHAGAGDLFCDFRHLSYRDGDYIVLPRGTMWRIETSSPTTILMIEATERAYRLPDKGVAGEHAIFDPAMLDVPAIDDHFISQQGETDWHLRLKRRGALNTISYPFNPLDAVGWKGTLLPVRINWRDIRPVMSHRYHLPPSVHTTFQSDRFVVCTFVPRPLESDSGALRVPFYHSNADYDEVIFYHAGDFFSRDNIHAGMISLHPAGFPHGPHPKAFAAGAQHKKTETDEVAVMVDARDPLDVAPGAASIEWGGYVDSWQDGDDGNGRRQDMILYGYWRSSAAYRVRIALNLKALEYEQRSLHLRDGDQRGSDYLKLNPQARVPTLVDGEIILTQSQSITEYLEETPLLPADPVQRARTRAIAAAVACDIHPINNLMVLTYLRGAHDAREDDIQRWYEHWIAEGLGGVEGLLADHPNTGRFCNGDSPTIADAFLVPQIYNARRYDCPLDQFPTIVRIDTACSELDAFVNAIPEHQPDAD